MENQILHINLNNIQKPYDKKQTDALFSQGNPLAEMGSMAYWQRVAQKLDKDEEYAAKKAEEYANMIETYAEYHRAGRDAEFKQYFAPGGSLCTRVPTFRTDAEDLPEDADKRAKIEHNKEEFLSRKENIDEVALINATRTEREFLARVFAQDEKEGFKNNRLYDVFNNHKGLFADNAEMKALYAKDPKGFGAAWQTMEQITDLGDVIELKKEGGKIVEKDGKAALMIDMLKPAYTLYIVDGKINLDLSGLSDEDLARLKAFFSLNGFDGYTFSDVDKELQARWEQAKDYADDIRAAYAKEETELLGAAENAQDTNTFSAAGEPSSSTGFSTDDEDESIQLIDSITGETKNKNAFDVLKERLRLQGYINGKNFKPRKCANGDIEFTCYATEEDRKNAWKNDGYKTFDLKEGKFKEDTRKYTYKVKYRMGWRVDKDGKKYLAFYVTIPPGAKMEKNYFTAAFAVMKSQGYTHVRIPDRWMGSEMSDVWNACGARLVIPTGHAWGVDEVKTMLKAAEGANRGEQETAEWMRMLAADIDATKPKAEMQLLAQELRDKADKWYKPVGVKDGKTIYKTKSERALEAGVLSDFRDDVISEIGKLRNKGEDATKILGYGQAYAKMLEDYLDNESPNHYKIVDCIKNPNREKARKELLNMLAKNVSAETKGIQDLYDEDFGIVRGAKGEIVSASAFDKTDASETEDRRVTEVRERINEATGRIKDELDVSIGGLNITGGRWKIRKELQKYNYNKNQTPVNGGGGRNP